mgnify:FL=1
MKKSLVIAILLLALTVSAFAGSFADVPANHWAYEAVNKLVAAGLITGYPDGTFKGQNTLTRYEVATILARLLENLAEARAELMDQVTFMLHDTVLSVESGLSVAQAEDVQAILQAVIEKNAGGAPVDALTAEDAAELYGTMLDLAIEFDKELMDLGIRVSKLEKRVADLEEATSEKPAVSFSGGFDVKFTDRTFEGQGKKEVDYYFINDEGEYEAVKKDPIVYTDPWDDGSDKLDASGKNEISRTFNLQADIANENLKATVKFDVHEDEDLEDILKLDNAELALENDKVAVVYNNANKVDIADYAFSNAEFNGVNVNFKNLGLDVFAGVKGYKVGEKVQTVEREFTYVDSNGYKYTGKKDVVKYKWNDDKNEYEAMMEDVNKDFYVFGAKKGFELAGLNLNAKYVGKAKQDKVDDKAVLDNWVGFDTAADLAGFDVNFDFAYYMPNEGDNGSLVRFGVARDLNVAGVEFNYKNRGDKFNPVSENGAIFNKDDGSYDKFTTGLATAGTTGWNVKVTPNLFTGIGLNTEVFYANVDEAGDKESKLALKGEMPLLIDGLKGKAEYALLNKEEDEKSTTTFGAEFEKGYVKANASYKMENNVDYEEGKEKAVTAFGVALADYPVFGKLTASAGFDYEKEAKDFDKATTKYNFGLGYLLGDLDLSYKFTNKTVDGKDADKGTYKTNELGATYPIVEGTDLVVNYKVFNLDADTTVKGIGDYTIKELTAGVSVSF